MIATVYTSMLYVYCHVSRFGLQVFEHRETVHTFSADGLPTHTVSPLESFTHSPATRIVLSLIVQKKSSFSHNIGLHTSCFAVFICSFAGIIQLDWRTWHTPIPARPSAKRGFIMARLTLFTADTIDLKMGHRLS